MSLYTKKIKMLILLALVIALSGCGTAPDSKDDPLAAFDVDAELPFATAAPEVIQATPTPAPTVPPSEPTPAPLDWRNDKLPDEVVASQNDANDDVPPATKKPTAAPTQKPTQKPTQAPTGGTASLHKGDESSAVKKMQQRLSDLGYYSAQINGKFGDKTVAAVKLFQETVGLSATGIATKETQEKLYSKDAPRFTPTPSPTKRPSSTEAPEYVTLSAGNNGPEVWNLQERLKELGYYTTVVDGHFGSGTQSAVKKFQKAVDYEQSGVATGALQALIFAGNAPTYASTVTAAPSATARTEFVALKRGDSGNNVKTLQKRLKELGYFSGSIGGNYQAQTVDAVKSFQEAAGLDVDGIASVEMQRRLHAADAPKASGSGDTVTPAQPENTGYAELSKGASGSRVEDLQQRLKDLGYYSGSVDGKYGDSTAKAVRAFESAYGKKETGIATASLQKELFSSGAKKNPNAGDASATEYVALKTGDTGERVKTLQRRLKELGYFDGDIGGNYLEKTTAAVKGFQKAIGVNQDGNASVELQKRLFAADAPATGSSAGSGTEAPTNTPGEYRDLEKGSKGDDVRDLQQRLKELRYYSGSVDGEYGDSTVSAVKAFEKAYGKKITGAAKAAMQKELFSENAKSNPEADTASAKDIKKGSEGDDVYRLQLRLIELGYLNEYDIVESTFDKPTSNAVLEAQKASGYKKQDGVAYAEFVSYLHSDKAYEISLYEYGDGP